MNYLKKHLIHAILYSCVVVLSLLHYCSAQNIFPGAKSYTVNDGLPQNNILGLAQDSTGFIWIGTKDGLARYDGYNFKVYRHSKDSLHSPANNSVTNLQVDCHGFLWIQYETHDIDRYNPATDIFDHLTGDTALNAAKTKASSFSLKTDHLKNIWLIDVKGFYCYNYSERKLKHYDTRNGILGDSSRAVVEDKSGKIWMITNLGLNAYDPINNSIIQIPYHFDSNKNFFGRDNMFGAGISDSGEIIITDLSNHYGNIIAYSPEKGVFKKSPVKSGRKPGQSFSGNTDILTAPNKENWFVCNGIICNRDGTREAKDFFEIPAPDLNDVISILIDRSGTLWFGRGAKGLYKITPGNNPFISQKYLHGNLDIDILTRELNLKYKDLPPDFFNSWLSYYFRKALDKKNDLIWIQNWFLEDFTTSYFNIRSKKLSKVVPLYGKAQMGIDVDSAGNAWMLADTNKICKMSYNDGKVYQSIIKISEFANFPSINSEALLNPILDGNFMWIMANQLGNVDFGLWKLYHLDLNSKKVTLYPLKPDNSDTAGNLLMVAKDPANRDYLWIGSTASGLIQFDKKTGNSHAFTTDDGLPNNTIYAIVPDNNNCLWLSTNKGLCRFNTITHTVKSFTVSDGLIDNEFNRWHYFKLPDGRIAFGGITGYTMFKPEDVKDDLYQPKIMISDIM